MPGEASPKNPIANTSWRVGISSSGVTPVRSPIAKTPDNATLIFGATESTAPDAALPEMAD
jgi:hypothetical protein